MLEKRLKLEKQHVLKKRRKRRPKDLENYRNVLMTDKLNLMRFVPKRHLRQLK